MIEIVRIDTCGMEYEIKIDEEFWVSGCEYEEFKKKLEELINEYRI
jgi:hypothetical protein